MVYKSFIFFEIKKRARYFCPLPQHLLVAFVPNTYVKKMLSRLYRLLKQDLSSVFLFYAIDKMIRFFSTMYLYDMLFDPSNGTDLWSIREQIMPFSLLVARFHLGEASVTYIKQHQADKTKRDQFILFTIGFSLIAYLLWAGCFVIYHLGVGTPNLFGYLYPARLGFGFILVHVLMFKFFLVALKDTVRANFVQNIFIPLVKGGLALCILCGWLGKQHFLVATMWVPYALELLLFGLYLKIHHQVGWHWRNCFWRTDFVRPFLKHACLVVASNGLPVVLMLSIRLLKGRGAEQIHFLKLLQVVSLLDISFKSLNQFILPKIARLSPTSSSTPRTVVRIYQSTITTHLRFVYLGGTCIYVLFPWFEASLGKQLADHTLSLWSIKALIFIKMIDGVLILGKHVLLHSTYKQAHWGVSICFLAAIVATTAFGLSPTLYTASIAHLPVFGNSSAQEILSIYVLLIAYSGALLYLLGVLYKYFHINPLTQSGGYLFLLLGVTFGLIDQAAPYLAGFSMGSRCLVRLTVATIPGGIYLLHRCFKKPAVAPGKLLHAA